MANFKLTLKSILSKQSLEYAELFLKVLAFLVGGYWTYYIFKYQYEILPETEPTSLILKSSVKRVGKLDTLTFYQIELTIQNKSKILLFLYVLAPYDTIGDCLGHTINETPICGMANFVVESAMEDILDTMHVGSE